MKKCKLKDNDWTILAEPDEKKHVLGIYVKAENGQVVEVRVRHNDGEEFKAKVSINGEPVLPMPIPEFQTHFDNYDFELRQ